MLPEDQQAHEGCNKFSAQCGVKTYEQVIKCNILSALKKNARSAVEIQEQ